MRFGDTAQCFHGRRVIEQQSAAAVHLHVDETGQQQVTVQIMPFRIADAWIIVRDDGDNTFAAHQYDKSFARAVIAEHAAVDESEQRIDRHYTVSVTLRRCGGTSGS